ncbi:H+/Cl- antiporter ClcA [Clostridium beijerinckii]|uniref:H+/Cl- antiporter ClcA n=1 Tax=Clostridium beijerinckii TaxID=1520 RepID=A0AAE5H5E1_CLOBE|nr:H+/Cl- antiporter ClcA [Clostridium beijerinckii]OOM19178.1 H(+)/Cl(-) exchange transporter ClcA [Clostridium beijerinckii]
MDKALVKFKRIKIEEKYLITSRASAGLAAAFNTPLAGAMFALEEVHKNFSPLVLLSALSSSLSADFIASEFFGLKPVYESLLKKFLQNIGEHISIGNKKNKSILEFPVCMDQI